MDIRQRPPKPPSPTNSLDHHHHHLHHRKKKASSSPSASPSSSSSPTLTLTPKASDALPLPLYLTNAIFFTLFFSVAYFLLHRWRDKIRSSTPLHVLTLSELAAILSLIASFIYLLGFFGIDFVQSFIVRPSNDHWDMDDVDAGPDEASFIPPPTQPDCSPSSPAIIMADLTTTASSLPLGALPSKHEEDDELVNSVVSGQIPSYSLESTLGDCFRAASVRRQAVQRTTGRSLSGMPLDGFDYDSILGRCYEMPVGYVQISVGNAVPLLLNGC